MVKIRREFIDVYWDDELEKPSWLVRRVEELTDGSLRVMDTDCFTDSKREALVCAERWSKKTNLPVVNEVK